MFKHILIFCLREGKKTKQNSESWTVRKKSFLWFQGQGNYWIFSMISLTSFCMSYISIFTSNNIIEYYLFHLITFYYIFITMKPRTCTYYQKDSLVSCYGLRANHGTRCRRTLLWLWLCEKQTIHLALMS